MASTNRAAQPAGSAPRRPSAREGPEQDREADFRTLAEDAPCAIFILQGAEIRFANAAAHEMTGCSSDDLGHCALWDVVHPDDRARVRRLLADMGDASALSRHELKLVRKDGRAGWMDFSARAVSYRGRPAIMGVGLDITERKLADAHIEALAYRDALTSLPNRRLLQDRVGVALAQARRRGERLGVLFLDLDHFKDVNDSLGHQAGDELLKAVADRLNGAMRRDDTVARFGGDEFVVLLAHIADANQAAHVARKILSVLRAPVRVGERDLLVNGSIGISVYPEDGTDFDSLLKTADGALYRAKEEGRGNGEGGLRPALEPDERRVGHEPARGPTASRLRDEQERGGAGLQGALEIIGAPSLLQMCQVGRLSGTLEATHATRTIRMTFEAGQLTAAASVEAQGRNAVMEFLAWTQGRFAFHSGANAGGEPISEPMDFLILEACRILDEKASPLIEN
jgi:diguanylate cyclase (GGDEF)-like protein/PAS domain S-box-containing protein